ncbi:plastocyanin/azurin family copper-binding protein [Natrinema amylolyticum]|uniref:plastocyanin/azurin family copper-binding protein n=1 Tax=Natrinema amylolyticum TaxID=2878679 RepID=UPI001CFB8E29|nr:plastocyanin/azurin family copper-binding protein [Natrinema amylolyticum]
MLFAGCLDENSADGDLDSSTGDGSGDEGPQANSDSADDGDSASDGDASADDDDAEADADTGTEDPDDDADEEPDPVETDRAFEIEPGTEIRFRSDAITWVGTSPSAIENVANPTIALTEGARYAIRWTDAEGAVHDIAIYDDEETVVDDLETPITDDPGDEQVLEFDASSEMAEYVCRPHYTAGMSGAIEIRSGGTDSSE